MPHDNNISPAADPDSTERALEDCCFQACSQGSMAAAVHYARSHAFRIVPVSVEPAFRPLIADWPNAATTEQQTISQWWQEWPSAVPAVATGQGSGIWVLDIDVKNGADGMASLAILEAEHGALGDSWTTATPSGGRHYWFAHPNEGPIRNIVGHLPGVDVRGDGGLVVLPPGRREAGQYEWLSSPGASKVQLRYAPATLVDDLSVRADENGSLTPQPPLSFASAAAAAAYLARVVEGECESVSTAVPGERNIKLFRSSARLGQFVAGNALPETVAEQELEAAAAACGLEAREARSTILSGLKRGATSPQIWSVA